MDKKFNHLLTLSITTAISLAATSGFAEVQTAPSFGSEIIDAADNGNISQVQDLLNSGSNPNDRGEFGTTPLMRAVYKNNINLVNVLLSSGANTDVKDIGGATAVMIAAREGHAAILQRLVERGANVNIADNEGYTPLMRASMAGNKEAVKTLVNSGAKVNAANYFGETALSQARAEGQMQIAALLTQNGASDDLVEVIKPSKAKEKVSKETHVTKADEADIVIDFSKGRLTSKTNEQIRQIAKIEKPEFSIGSFYVPKKTVIQPTPAARPEMIEPKLEMIEIPTKPSFVQKQVLSVPAPKPLPVAQGTIDAIAMPQATQRMVEIDKVWLSDIGTIATTAVRPYQLASNEMIVPGTQNNVLDLGNFKSAEFASKKISELKASYPEIFNSLPLKVVHKNGGLHTYYQINAGIIGSNQEAKDLCKKLLSSGINCQAVRTEFKSQEEFNSYAGDVVKPKETTTAAKASTVNEKQDLLGPAPAPKVESKALSTPSSQAKQSNIGSFASVTAFNNMSPAATETPAKEETILEAKPSAPPTLKTITTAQVANEATMPEVKPIPETPAPIVKTITPSAPTSLKSIVPTTPVETAPAVPPAPPAMPEATQVEPAKAPTPVVPAAPTKVEEAKPVIPEAVAPAIEAKPAEVKPNEPKAEEVKSSDVQASEPKAEEKKPVEVKPEAKPAPKKVVKKKTQKKLPKPGVGKPPADLTTGQPMSAAPTDGKFEVARPVKSIDSIIPVADMAPAWLKIDNFKDQNAARNFLNELKAQNPSLGGYRTKVSAPYTMPEKTVAQIGPFTNQAEAQALCSAISQRGLNCSMIKSNEPRLIDNLPGINQVATAPTYNEQGDWIIQLGSYDSYEAAQGVWNDYSNQSSKLKKLPNYIIPTESGYRLRAGNFASSAQADSFCDELRAKSISCIIIKN